MSTTMHRPGDEKRPSWKPLIAAKQVALGGLNSARSAARAIRPETLKGMTGPTFSLFIAVLTLLAAAPWLIEIFHVEPTLHSRHTTGHVKVACFKDSAFDPEPFRVARVGQMGSTIAGIRPIYDESYFTFSYQLYRHKEPLFQSEFHTSGIGQVHPIYPPNFSPESGLESYEKSMGKSFSIQIDLKDEDGKFRDLVLMTMRSVNGLQRKSDGVKYESDFGLHIRFETDIAELIVDFSDIDYDNLIRGVPQTFILTSDKQRIPLPSTYEDGVVMTRATRPPLKATIVCDWQWNTEKLTNGQKLTVK